MPATALGMFGVILMIHYGITSGRSSSKLIGVSHTTVGRFLRTLE